MAKKENNIHPAAGSRRKISRIIIHLFGWTGMAMLYYIAFSFFFDTPLEYAMKNSTQKLNEQYTELNARYDSVELVLKNVVERDRNIFRILFEADPYDLDAEFESGKWDAVEDMLNKPEAELGKILAERTRSLNKKISELEYYYTELGRKVEQKQSQADFIPSIQPVVNNELTLLTASYGQRIHPFYKTLSTHHGVDYTVPEGTRVFATADGRVKDITSKQSTSGLTVIISHGNGYETQYSHLSKSNVQKGDVVKRGDIIALSGNTGLSLAPHLHYEIKHNGMRVDPIHYFFMELTPGQYRKIQEIAKAGMQSFD